DALGRRGLEGPRTRRQRRLLGPAGAARIGRSIRQGLAGARPMNPITSPAGKCLTNPFDCPGQIVHDAVGSLGHSAFSAIVESFVGSANSLLPSFAKAFVAIPPVDLASPGIRSVYGISLGLAGVVAALLLFGQVIRTALTHDGSALAQ